MLSTISKRWDSWFGKAARPTSPQADDLRNVFASYAASGSAQWRDDPHEQVRHCRHWVYAAVRAISARVAGTPLKFHNSETGQPLPPSHPLPRLMRAVNPFETSVSLWMKTITYLELTGNAYWYLPKNALGAVAEIWVLPSQHMRVIPSRENFISGYEFRNGALREEFAPGEIVHLKYPAPDSIYYGRGPLQAAASSVDAHEAMKEAERRSFEAGVFPGLAIQTAEKLSREVRERLEATLRNGFGGAEKAGRALILEQGLTVRPFTRSPREMDFMESSRATRDEILAVFGVPAAVAGVSEDVNRASAEAMLYTFAENTIAPKLRLLASQLTQDLCPAFDSRIEAVFDSPLPAIRAEDRADLQSRIELGITTPEEERARLGLAPLEPGMPTKAGVDMRGMRRRLDNRRHSDQANVERRNADHANADRRNADQGNADWGNVEQGNVYRGNADLGNVAQAPSPEQNLAGKPNFPAGLTAGRGDPADSAFADSILADTARAIVRGQERRLRSSLLRHGLPAAKAAEAVLADPAEAGRLEAPMLPAIMTKLAWQIKWAENAGISEKKVSLLEPNDDLPENVGAPAPSQANWNGENQCGTDAPGCARPQGECLQERQRPEEESAREGAYAPTPDAAIVRKRLRRTAKALAESWAKHVLAAARAELSSLAATAAPEAVAALARAYDTRIIPNAIRFLAERMDG